MKRKVGIVFFVVMLVFGMSCFAQQQSKETLDYIEKYKDIAMTEMVNNKIPASITLAQGILESGNGNSILATKGNNHFGIKCHSDWKGKTMRVDDDAPKECFRVYDSAEESFRDHSEFLKRDRYKALFDLKISDYKGWAKGLKAAGYATLPTYALVLIKLIENYGLQAYDEQVISGKFKVKKKVNKSVTVSNETEKPAVDVSSDTKVSDKKQKKLKKHKTQPAPPTSLDSCVVVGVTSGKHYIRENFGVKFIFTKENDELAKLAKELGVNKYQLVKYNNLGAKTTFKEGEILYIEPKRLRSVDTYKYHVIQKGETLSHVSRMYAVRLERIFKMNGLDETSVLQVGQEVRLR